MKILLQNPIIYLIDGIHIRIRIHLQTISHDEEKKTEKYYNYCYARHLIFNHHLNPQQKSNLKDYYKAYTNRFLTEILKYKRPDLALKIIERESSGINYFKNKLYLFLYRLSGKGISKIKI